MTISVIIPALDEEAEIGETIQAVQCLPGCLEVILVDGGSQDRTASIARQLEARVILSGRGRGAQMQKGAKAASGEVLWFVHADTRPSAGSTGQMITALRDHSVAGGNFRLEFDGSSPGARLLNALQPVMRRLGFYYGDSTIFVRRSVYFDLGGFRSYQLFEDSDLIRRIKSAGRFVTLPAKVRTSSRRFERKGFLLTCFLWSGLQVLFWLGVSPERIGKFYSPVRRTLA